jgi:RelA/SpoT family (p)ppGpp synthetase
MDDREPASLRALLKMCAAYMSAADLELVRGAYTLAASAHRGALRLSGEPFIEHPLAVARVLASLAMDAAGIAAALLHDTVEDTSCTLGEIADQFGPVIAEIVDGVTKFELVSLGAAGGSYSSADQRLRQQKETVRKLVVAMLRDPRVVLLKLADRLHNMRTLAAMSPAQRTAKARETLEIYAPLADRIGLQVFKSELEDLAFASLYPEQFERVSRRIAQEAAARMEWIERVCEQVRIGLLAEGISAAVNWRLKRPYRAYLEMEESGMREADLHDLIAFRVLVNTDLECYRAMGAIHSLWHHLDARIRDYIATPKVNGYRSLHTAVFAFDRRAQFHIRTHDMHRRVQHGVATHWLDRAARGEPVDAALRLAQEDLPGWVAQLDDWHRELRLSADAFVDALKSDVFDDQVFVFTPKGDIIDLAAGSTPLDFAYRIHTMLGDHCAGARVQTMGPYGVPILRIVAPDYQLKTGDVVTIVTDPGARPRPEWLQIVRTRNAKEKVIRALRAQAREQGKVEGTADDGTPAAGLETGRVAPLMHPSGKPAVVQLAHCCYPCPEDKVVGLPGPNRRVAIHRDCCRTLGRALARRAQRHDAPPPLQVDWRALASLDYRMAIAVYGQDHAGLMHELAQCITSQDVSLAATFATANQDRKKAIVTLICVFTPAFRPDMLFRRLYTLPGVTRVERDTRLGCAAPDAEW